MSTTLDIFTIGYATKPIEEFIKQLTRYDINVIADVRSVPYSKVFFDYHQDALQLTLRRHGIRYVYLGDELGPRSKDDRHYENGQVQFRRLMKSPLFVQGVERLKVGIAKGFRIALMCAEKDAATCHRSLLIGYELERTHGFSISHIDHEGGLEVQHDLEKRLQALTQTVPDMFSCEQDCLDIAYDKQVKNFAYVKPAD